MNRVIITPSLLLEVAVPCGERAAASIDAGLLQPRFSQSAEVAGDIILRSIKDGAASTAVEKAGGMFKI
jgi:hypothetical protein